MERYSIQNQSVGLRPLNEIDYPYLHKWHTDLRNLHLWQIDRDILNYDDFITDFEKRLRRNIDTLFIICDSNTQTPIGFMYNYNANYRDLVSYCCIYLAPEHIRSGYGLTASLLLGNYLFQNCGFRKVYAEIFEYNTKVVKLAKWFGFEEEGRLKKFRWYNNQYWDVHILALSQNKYQTNKHKLFSKTL